MIRSHWPVLESPPPPPDRWAQFSTEQITAMVRRRLPADFEPFTATREEMVLWLELKARVSAKR